MTDLRLDPSKVTPQTFVHAVLEAMTLAEDQDPVKLRCPWVLALFSEAPPKPEMDGATLKRWRVRLICCGRDDGIMSFDTYEEAEAFRETYTSGPGVHTLGYSAPEHSSGHRRAAIISEAPREEPTPKKLHVMGTKVVDPNTGKVVGTFTTFGSPPPGLASDWSNTPEPVVSPPDWTPEQGPAIAVLERYWDAAGFSHSEKQMVAAALAAHRLYAEVQRLNGQLDEVAVYNERLSKQVAHHRVESDHYRRDKNTALDDNNRLRLQLAEARQDRERLDPTSDERDAMWSAIHLMNGDPRKPGHPEMAGVLIRYLERIGDPATESIDDGGAPRQEGPG